MKTNPMQGRCGAKTRSGNPCKNNAMANGRCRMHGGKSTGAPPEKMKRNKKVFATGEFERIFIDELNDSEKELYSIAPKADYLRQIDHALGVLYVKELGMSRRLKQYREDQMVTITQRTLEESYIHRETSKKVIRNQEEEIGQQRAEELIQRQEEALFRLQERKAKLLDLKHKIEKEEGEGHPDQLPYMKALAGLVSDVWRDGDGEEEE
ncbi:HGGxSTG domain-containing protein [Mechercharimyces sp. CAU 1602]|uniref:HGGxSTG domain-containing protein n=1 Tax=Mechercharimyces sp. CAU 1602 TaxID=2973933 RepID=UPI00216398BB|nr:HGGxSTG domain-containing protein [Mechercharimyces sp. CAU 1602]MCS1350286.1 hypothetical protein [Mechercharimyces sp. CAU 1602]